MDLDLHNKINIYGSNSVEEFRQNLVVANIPVESAVLSTAFEPTGIYVSPETKNAYFEYSYGETDSFRYEQYITSYHQDLALSAELYAATFVIELLQPTVPLYISSRTSFNFNSILQFPSVPILRGIDKVQLEGDFSEFFTVYSRDNHTLDAFTTLAPNIMIDILASGNNYDIEFAGKYIYIYQLCSPMYTNINGKERNSINFSSDQYISMRNFGLKYGARLARAARPSEGETISDVRPFWELVNEDQRSNNRNQYLWLAGILLYLLLSIALWFIVIPISIVALSVRTFQWYYRRKRLLARYDSSLAHE